MLAGLNSLEVCFVFDDKVTKVEVGKYASEEAFRNLVYELLDGVDLKHQLNAFFLKDF